MWILIGLLLCGSLEAVTWGVVQNISIFSGTDPKVGLSSGGNAEGVWVGFNGLSNVIRSVNRVAGIWAVPVTLSASGQDAEKPVISMNATGSAVAVWLRFNGTESVVQASTFNGLIWSIPQTLSPSGISAGKPKVAINSGGSAIAIWEESPAAGGHLIKVRRLSLGVWGAAQTISNPLQDAFDPDIAYSNAGNALAVFTTHNGSMAIVQSATFFGGSWLSPQTISNNSGDAGSNHVAMNASGNGVATWREANGNNMIYMADFVLGIGPGAWTAPQLLSTPGNDHEMPQIAFNNTGNVVVAWFTFFPQEIKAQRRMGGVWSGEETISVGGMASAYPKVAINNLNQGVAVWDHFNGVDYRSVGAAFNAASWDAPIVLSQAKTVQSLPDIKVNDLGDALAVWSRTTSSSEQIEALPGSL